MTIALVLLIAALICGVLALLGVASRVDLTAVAVVLIAVYLLLGAV
jgi:hypothetical protein